MQMSSRLASHAKTFRMQESAPDLPGNVLAFGGKLFEPFAWFDQGSSCWRTWQRCLIEGWAMWRQTWPRQAMTLNMIAYRPARSAHRITGTVSGLLPTPSGVNGGKNHTVGRLDEWGGSSNPFRGTEIGKVRCASFEEWMMGLPIGWTALTASETD